MLVRDLMARDPITVQKEGGFREALRLIRQEGIRHVPVLEGTRLVGIVTDRDLRQATATPSSAATLTFHELDYLLDHLTIEAIMTRDVVTVAPGASLYEAARLLSEGKIGCLPVVEGQEFMGMITEGIILRAYVEQHDQGESALRAELLVEDRPGAFEAVTSGVGAGPAVVMPGTAVRNGERRPVLLIRAPAPVAADLRRRLATAGHPSVNG